MRRVARVRMGIPCLLVALELTSANCGSANSHGAIDAMDTGSVDAADTSTVDANDGEDAGPPCSDACQIAEQRCGPSGGTQTCSLVSDGCTAWGAEIACQGTKICMSAGETCACPPILGCTRTGTFCLDLRTLITCTADAWGCFNSATVICQMSGACAGPPGGAVCAPI